jgi:hypothetical protein
LPFSFNTSGVVCLTPIVQPTMLSAVVAALSIASCGSFDLNQWCQNNASNRMIGIGIPSSQSKTPRPKPMVAPHD